MKQATKMRFHNAKMNISKQKPLIMTTIGIMGSIGALYSAFKVAPKAKEILNKIENNKPEGEKKTTTLWKKTKAIAPIVWPVVVMEGVSIGCSVGSYKMSTKRLSALATAYAISERRFSDYKDEVIKQIGKNKEKKIHDEAIANELQKHPISNTNEIIMLPGKTLCYDGWTGRYFYSDMETLRSIENNLKDRLRDEMYISLNDLYYELDIAPTEVGDEMGWNVDNPISFSFSSNIAPNNEPCLIVDYDVYPRFDFRKLY